MRKLIIPVFICTLIAFTFIPFSTQISSQDIIAQSVNGKLENKGVSQGYEENETVIIKVNQSMNIVEDGVIEPGDNQTLWFKGSGGGYIIENGYKNNFGFNACFNNTVEGHINYVDRAEKYHFKSELLLNATIKMENDTFLLRVYGFGEIQGEKYMFKLEAVDRGEPGVHDEFHLWIYTESGLLYDYSWGVISGGNINIQC